jgi:hypothetical protein
MQADDKTVDIDTSGPGAEVQLEENKKPENETVEVQNETTTEDNVQPNDTSEKSDEQLDVRSDENSEEQKTEKKEEVKEDKDEHEKYSDSVQKRIAKLTKKMREAERQREEALAFARRIQDENKSLTSKVNVLDTDYVAEMEGRVKSSLLAAQQKLIAARDANDKKAEVEALTSISQLGYEQAKVAELKTKQEMEKKVAAEKPKEQAQPYQPTVQAPDPRAEDWATKNDWFGKDNAMTYTAFDLHRKLTEEEGFDPQTDEYYKEIDKRIRLEFPHKFDTPVEKTTSKPTQTVASATRSPKTGRRSVKLTPSQVAIAKKLGVPLEEYAKQLINTKEV